MARQLHILILAASLVLIALPGFLHADASKASRPNGLTDAQQEAAVQFVKKHHPQLNRLINRLQKQDEEAYTKALRDISRTCERLERIKSRDPERYEVDLSLWKVDSRIRLVAAQMVGSHRASLEPQLRGLLNERMDLRLQQLEMERQRLNSRLEKLDTQISVISAGRSEAIDRDVERLIKSVRARTSSVSGKPSSQSKSRPQREKKKSGPEPRTGEPSAPPAK